MILRKPYAFLIKYFKIIHIIMFIIFGYYVFMLREIYSFLSNFVQNNNYAYYDEMTRYIPALAFLLIIIVIVATIFIYSLMKEKNKPILYYKVMFIYSITLLISLIYFYSFFSGINDTTYTPLKIVISRDISAFMFFINFFFVGFNFIRGFGFDIKKFSFEQDKKELHIEDADREEFELNIGIDKDQINTYFKREQREFKNYIKENKIFFIPLSIIIFVGLAIYLYTFFVNNRVYRENDVIYYDNYAYFTVNKSMITNLDKYSNIISNESRFILVNLSIETLQDNISFDSSMFRININDSYYYPEYNYNDRFDDIGEIYNNKTIPNKVKKNYYIVFKIPNKISGNVYFEILKNNKNYSYNRVKLNLINERIEIQKYALNQSINIMNNSFTILEYMIVNSVRYNYEECENKVCNTYIKTIVPSLNNKILLLKINTDSEIQDEFYENSIWIKYGNKMISSKDIKFLGKNDNNIYLDVMGIALNSSNLSIIFKTRSTEYEVVLGV